MKHLVAIALAGACMIPAYGIDYGSTTLAFEKNPEAAVEQFSKELCAKYGATAKVTHQTQAKVGYAYVSCEANGKKVGDAMAKYAQGRADINYRIQ